MKILGVSGSLRGASLNTLVLGSLPRLAPAGMELAVYDGLAAIPPYNEDLDTAEPPPEVARLRAQVSEADGLVWVMPEFNHSVPGVLKNAIDWMSHPVRTAHLLGKTSAIIVVTQGRGGFRGMADLARILRDLGGFVVPAPEVCVQFAHTRVKREPDGTVQYIDPVTEGLIEVLLASLSRAVDTGLGAAAGAAWRDVFAFMDARSGES